jgi:hypothetical protein
VFAIVNRVVLHITEKPLPCENEAVLAVFYRGRMFLRIALANSPALFAFVGAFTFRGSWIYYAGLLISLPALLHAAPTRSALVRDQDELTARGCPLSLVAALRQPPPK